MTDQHPTPDQSSLAAIGAAMEAMHGQRQWHWWPDADPFEVIVGAILVQNTMWTNVEKALDRLRARDALTPAAMAALSEAELEGLVQPSGQFRQKAKKLRAFLHLVARHGNLEALLALSAPQLRSELLGTWGIGPETADCIILYAARQPAWIIDAYLRRIFTRLDIGPVHTDDYGEWQRFFVANLDEDRDRWARLRAEIVLHGKHLCLKNRPRCAECLLAVRCPGRS